MAVRRQQVVAAVRNQDLLTGLFVRSLVSVMTWGFCYIYAADVRTESRPNRAGFRVLVHTIMALGV